MPGRAATVAAGGGGFDADRVHVQHRRGAVLVMDRVSGRWTALPGRWADAVAVVGYADAVATVPAVARLRAHLEDRGIGMPGSERTFTDLNTLILKVTGSCNQACAYCYDFDAGSRMGVMDPQVAAWSIEQALDLAPGGLQVILHGGEPMLVWDLVETVVLAGERAAAARGVPIGFVGQTNMSRLDARIEAFSTAHGLHWGVSLDGPPDVHDRFRVHRDGRGTYAQFQAALQAHPRFVRGCGVLSTVTTANQARLPEVAAHVRDLGMASWDWTLFQPIGRGRAQPQVFAPDTDTVVGGWLDLFDEVLAGVFDGFPVKPVLRYVDNFRHGPGANMCMRPQCGAARDLVSISADATIQACDCIDPTGPLAGLGRAGDDALACARSAPVADLIRSRDLSGTRCGGCLWWGICGGGCPAHADPLNTAPELACALALTAFDRIADQVVQPDGALRRYLDSVAR